jgi:hypothetical protein
MVRLHSGNHRFCGRLNLGRREINRLGGFDHGQAVRVGEGRWLDRVRARFDRELPGIKSGWVYPGGGRVG